MPASGNPHWQGRYGALTLILPDPTGGNKDTLFVLGGDSDDRSFTSNDLPERQLAWSNGYKNDVWSTSGTEWVVKPDVSLKNGYRQKVPRQKSQLKWKQATSGILPPPGVSFDSWIKCDPAMLSSNPNASLCDLENPPLLQWSPRRFHKGVVFKGSLYVMGGRARESVEMGNLRHIGGIVGPIVGDIVQGKDGANYDQLFTNLREASVYKSDVWKSDDGKAWTLVTPGCKAPQESLIADGNLRYGKRGKASEACRRDEDCYGPSEKCIDSTCVCQMWSPREQHQTAVYQDKDGVQWIYVVGGYTSALFASSKTDFGRNPPFEDIVSACGDFACGDTDASAYRQFMSDVWRSRDGEKWDLVTVGTEYNFPGRGGHQMLLIPSFHNTPAYFYIFGGRGGNPKTNELIYYNDVWRASADDPKLWFKLNSSDIGWTPRTSHVVLLETPSALNGNTRNVLLYGGLDQNGTILDDVWMWRPDVKGDPWRKDYNENALYRSGSGVTFKYSENSPTVHYVYPDAPIEYLKRFWVPPASTVKGSKGSLRAPELKLLTDKRLTQLHSVGIKTIRDLATANKYQILRLRGQDYPQVAKEDRMDFMDICDVRRLAEAVVKKCSVEDDIEFFDGYKMMPWSIRNVFGGPPPAIGSAPEWHDADYSVFYSETDRTKRIEEWDGCTYLSGITLPNVIGLGKVTQVCIQLGYMYIYLYM